jgi:molybdopterin converting factor small subunit
MRNLIEVFLFGSLRAGAGETHPPRIHFDLGQPIPLSDLLGRLQIQPDRVQMSMVNHRAVPPDHLILPGDRVALFPREYAIFADWKNLRH